MRAAWPVWLACGAALVGAASLAGRAPRALPTAPRMEERGYPYGGKTLDLWIADSSHATGHGSPRAFHAWMDRSFHIPNGPEQRWTPWLERQRRERAGLARPATAAKDIALSEALFRSVKRSLPNFTLDRGFEFACTMKRRERQCMLQSVLIASLLQAAGADAGIAMVFRNPHGQPSNNGHVVVVTKLADGRDIIVDASERAPHIRHQGLMVFAPGQGFRYVEPVYGGGSSTILAYRDLRSGRRVPATAMRPLPNDFVRSQFTYYRGERAPGGLVAKNPTPAGLGQSERHLRKSVAQCPRNPLPALMLARTLERQGRTAEAMNARNQARRLYADAGWLPPGVEAAD